MIAGNDPKLDDVFPFLVGLVRIKPRTRLKGLGTQVRRKPEGMGPLVEPEGLFDIEN